MRLLQEHASWVVETNERFDDARAQLPDRRFEAAIDPRAPARGVEVEHLEVRNQPTERGSCSFSGTPGLN